MKKFFFVAIALLAIANSSRGQTGALILRNHNTNCSLFVYVLAIDNNLGNGTPCDIAFSFVLPPASSCTTPSVLSFADPTYAFSYLTSATTPFTYSALSSEISSKNSDWAWTDATFQTQCEGTGGNCGTSGGLSESFPSSCTGVGNCLISTSTSWSPSNCNLSPTNYIPSCSSGPGATWTSPAFCALSDVVIDFY